MQISFYEKIQLATHIERKINGMNIPTEAIMTQVYKDIERQIKRAFGLNRKNPNLDEKYLYDAHELIDMYELPIYLQEQIVDCNA